MNNQSIIRGRFLGLFKKLFPEITAPAGKDLWDVPLLSKEINLQARDLLCLFFTTESEFKISIPQQDIAEGRFSTINSITDIILECLE